MTETTEQGRLRYRPPARVQRKFLAKKALVYVVCAATVGFAVWFVWPGVTSAPTLTLDYLTMVVGLFVIAVGLALLVVIAWNERLFTIEDGRITWPFPFRKADGNRTRYILLGEITGARRVSTPDGRRELELVLRDGTQLIMPQSVIGDEDSDVLDAVVRYVSEALRDS